jgi:hypothetical protein
MNFGELPGVVAVGVQCPDRPAILGQSLNVLIEESRHQGVEADRVRAGRWVALGQAREQSVLGELSVLVDFVGRAEALNPPGHALAVAKARSSQPHAAAEVLAHDLAVLADTQRRASSACHIVD